MKENTLGRLMYVLRGEEEDKKRDEECNKE